MKKVRNHSKKWLSIIVFTGSVMICNKGSAQITLEPDFDTTNLGYFYTTNLGNNEWKYVFQNPMTNSFSLFNMDFSSHLLNIQIPVTDSIKNGFTVIYISRTLVDCDSTNIEYVYNNPNDLHHKLRIFRTDGKLLFQLDSAHGPHQVGKVNGGSYRFRPVKNTPAGTKLFLEQAHNNGVPQVYVHSLCGTRPASIMEFRQYYDLLKVSPDQHAMKLYFEFIQPNNQGRYLLIVLDKNARLLKRVVMDTSYSLALADFSNGTYFYTLTTREKVCQSGKFNISK